MRAFTKGAKATRQRGFQRLLWFAALILLSSCSRFQARVDPKIVPAEATILVHGKPERVAASRDDDGVQSDFLESIVLVKPKSAADLQAFLDRCGGTVIGDNTIPKPPAELGLSLTDEQRKPTGFKVRINPAKANAAGMSANAAATGLKGRLAFSSDAGLRTYASILDARAAGFRVSGDYIYRDDQTFPSALFSSQERQTKPGPPPTFNDPFTNGAYNDFGQGPKSNQANVFLAWQFIAAHGIQRRTKVAIIDGGFYLDAAGKARGTDSDFPPPPGRPLQYDIDFDDPFAGDANALGCGPGNPCWWHGTAAAGVVTGIGGNRLGEMGTGGQVADPILLRFNGEKEEQDHAIRTAIAWGADVVSMSFGGNCNVTCRDDDEDDNPFADAVNGGSKVVFVASAGNGYGNPPVGVDVNDAGSSTFIHPCIEDHVICVGSLSPGAQSKAQFSNFGPQVQIFAPTNIPVMSYPPSTGVDSAGNSFPLPLAQADGPPVPQNFGGTSASAPFVAGVVAMMKSVNPDLNHEAVAQILRETAQPGAVSQVTRTVDAYAAVRRAAGNSKIVPDSLENNDLDTAPANLGSLPPYNRPNLNIDQRDLDYLRFDSPNGSQMTLTLNYPQGLGAITVQSLMSQKGVCEAPTLVSKKAIPTGGQSFLYRVPGGPLQLGLRAADVNAYNIAITFASDTYPIDDFEPNNTVAAARRLSTPRSVHVGPVAYLGNDPRVTIDATIHAGNDIDFYIVQGAKLTLAERIFIAGAPSLEIYGNDSLINLEVFRLNADNSQGASVGAVNGVRCAPAPLKVLLDEDAYFLVKVSGSPGRYTLRNSVTGDERKFPGMAHDRLYEVLNPGEPVEHVFRFPEIFVFVADLAFSGVQTSGQNLHMKLFDVPGKLVAEGLAGNQGETLNLTAAIPGQIYALEVTPRNGAAERPQLAMTWNPTKAARTSNNLLKNPGAEIVVPERPQEFSGWEQVAGRPLPVLLSYGEGDDTPSPQDPAAKDRGLHLFAGENKGGLNGMQQNIPVGEEWRNAVDAGRVGAHLAAFLGGNRAASDRAMVKLTFLDGNRRSLGDSLLPTVGPREREEKTGLFPVESNFTVPPGTVLINLELAFGINEGSGLAYADNLELTFAEYPR